MDRIEIQAIKAKMSMWKAVAPEALRLAEEAERLQDENARLREENGRLRIDIGPPTIVDVSS